MSYERAHESGNECELGKGVEESDSTEQDRETMSNKRIKEMSIDRLSSLPDCILLHILSFLECDLKKPDLKQDVVTSVLSKRWRFLWTELPKLNFCDLCCWDPMEIRDFVSWVNRTIILRSGYLKQFKVDFYYEGYYVSDVNVWVCFAVKNNVKEFSLKLRSGRYTLPQVMYSNSSLTLLSLRRCILAPQLKIEWPCLSELKVKDVELPDDVIQKILLGCPVLCRLELKWCWGFKCLDINSEYLHELVVYDSEDKNNTDLLEISAPCLRSLYVSLSAVKKKLQLINVRSLVTADIFFTECNNSLEVWYTTMELLQMVLHAEKIILGGMFVEVLSKMVQRGWRLPQSKRKSLELDTLRDRNSIPGILGLLESSPNLETLLIECVDSYEKPLGAWVPAARNDLDCDLLNLKTVHLFSFADPNHAGEPMLTIARTLLKRATTLEKMHIEALGNLTKFASEFTEMSEKVLSYPRSSEKAVVVLLQ